jgi:ABC-type Na+ efflux pump permease subunit
MYEASNGGDFGGLLVLLLYVAAYFYFFFAQYKIAQKLNTPNAWFAFVPILNIVQLVQMAQKPMWWFLLLLVPVINIVCWAILWIEVAKRVNKSPAIGFLTIIPLINFITIGIMGFSGSPSPKSYPSHDQPAPKQPQQVG